MMTFKLAALAHLEVQGNGSCGDIAASSYGGWIAFATFDQQWLKRNSKVKVSLIYSPKSGLILRLHRYQKFPLLTFIDWWTGSPASTSDLVDQVNESRADKQTSYEEFLADSKTCVEQIVTGFHQQDISLIKQMIKKIGAY